MLQTVYAADVIETILPIPDRERVRQAFFGNNLYGIQIIPGIMDNSNFLCCIVLYIIWLKTVKIHTD